MSNTRKPRKTGSKSSEKVVFGQDSPVKPSKAKRPKMTSSQMPNGQYVRVKKQHLTERQLTISFSNFFAHMDQLLRQFKALGPNEEIYDIRFTPYIKWPHGPDGLGPVDGEGFDITLTTYNTKEGVTTYLK